MIFTDWTVFIAYATSFETKERLAREVGRILKSEIVCWCVEWPGEDRSIGEHHLRCSRRTK